MTAEAGGGKKEAWVLVTETQPSGDSEPRASVPINQALKICTGYVAPTDKASSESLLKYRPTNTPPFLPVGGPERFGMVNSNKVSLGSLAAVVVRGTGGTPK